MDFRPDYIQIFKQWHQNLSPSYSQICFAHYCLDSQERCPQQCQQWPRAANLHCRSTIAPEEGEKYFSSISRRDLKANRLHELARPRSGHVITWNLQKRGQPHPKPTGERGVLLPEAVARQVKRPLLFSTTRSYGVDYEYAESSGELREEGKKTMEWQRVFIEQVEQKLNEFEMVKQSIKTGPPGRRTVSKDTEISQSKVQSGH